MGPKTFYACIIGPVMADFRRWFMKKDPTMNRLSASRFCVVSGKYLTVAGLVLLAIRSFAIEIFSFPPENNYIAPAGRVMEPEEETFSFAAASDTGAKNAPIERIVKQAQEGGNRFLLYLGGLVRYRNISHFRWIVSELDEKLDLPFYMIPGNHEIADRFGSDNKYFYRMVFGPLYYWFSYGNVMFIGLDSSEERYDDAQLEWLEDVLEKVRPHFRYCVVYTHVPPLTDPSWRKQILTEPSVERLGRILQRHKIDLILAAHIHQYWRGSVWGIPVVTLMSSGQKIRSDVNKYGYVTVKVGKKGIEEIRPHYLADNMDDDNEYIELLFSNILVDDRFLVICLSVLGGGLLLLAAGVIGGRGR